MEHAWDKIRNATTPNEFRAAIVEELNLRAWQERAVSQIGRTTKAKRAAHEQAAIALETLAADLTDMEIVNQRPAGLAELGIPIPQPTPPDELLAQTAKRYLGIETLKIQNSNSLDFHDVSVWNVKAALEAAWKAGKAAQ